MTGFVFVDPLVQDIDTLLNGIEDGITRIARGDRVRPVANPQAHLLDAVPIIKGTARARIPQTRFPKARIMRIMTFFAALFFLSAASAQKMNRPAYNIGDTWVYEVSGGEARYSR